jgi:hypothetical protein
VIRWLASLNVWQLREHIGLTVGDGDDHLRRKEKRVVTAQLLEFGRA